VKAKAVFKDDAVRCEKCGVEIWEGVDCGCGVDGADHEGLKEAYEEKFRQGWTAEDEQNFRELDRKRMKHKRDLNRKRRFSPRFQTRIKSSKKEA